MPHDARAARHATSPAGGPGSQGGDARVTLSEKATFGFIVTVLELLRGVRRALAKAGWDVDAVLDSLQGLHDAAVAANEAQEAAKRQLRATTESFVALKRQAYLAASGYLDMAIAAVGKGSEEAKNLRRYRIRARRRQGDAMIPTPVQPPSEK